MKVISVPPFVSRLHMNDVVGVEVSFPDWYDGSDPHSDCPEMSFVEYHPLTKWSRRVPDIADLYGYGVPPGARVVISAWIEGPSRPGGVKPIYCVSGVMPPRTES